MEFRSFGSKRPQVSTIGFGCWGIGGKTDGNTSYGETDDAVSLLAIKQAIDLGINYFDTSPAYGRSETLLGLALQSSREHVVIATKAGYSDWKKPPTFDPIAIENSCLSSLARLQTDYIDILQLHNPPIERLIRDPSILKCLEQLIRDGQIRHWGLSIKSPTDGLIAIKELGATILQINLNMLDTRAVDSGVLDVARDYGVALIAKTPLCFGFLSTLCANQLTFPKGDHRNNWSKKQISRWMEGAQVLARTLRITNGKLLSETALRFCLTFPEVVTVIPGMMTPEEVLRNAKAACLGPLSDAEKKQILKLNLEGNFFSNK